jgi:hypothetical protein
MNVSAIGSIIHNEKMDIHLMESIVGKGMFLADRVQGSGGSSDRQGWVAL